MDADDERRKETQNLLEIRRRRWRSEVTMPVTFREKASRVVHQDVQQWKVKWRF